MAIVPTEIKYRLSGGAANSSPDASLGGVKSSVDVPVGIFDDVSSAEAGAGITDYRCVYVQNTNGTLTLIGAKLWIQAQLISFVAMSCLMRRQAMWFGQVLSLTLARHTKYRRQAEWGRLWMPHTMCAQPFNQMRLLHTICARQYGPLANTPSWCAGWCQAILMPATQLKRQ